MNCEKLISLQGGGLLKLFIYEENNKYHCTDKESETRYKELVYVINSVEDIGDFMLSEFERDKHDVDYLIAFAFCVKNRLEKQQEDIEM